jgi:hypothetical protein
LTTSRWRRSGGRTQSIRLMCKPGGLSTQSSHGIARTHMTAARWVHGQVRVHGRHVGQRESS